MPESDLFIVNCFHGAGRCLSGGMAVVSITWQELKSYSELSGNDLTPWESEQIINMSREYCSWLSKAKDPLISAPWHDDDFNEAKYMADVEINAFDSAFF